MTTSDPGGRITELLQSWQQGNAQSGEEVVPLVYAELRRIARIRLSAERAGHTLQPTALVHEAWVRLMQQHGATWQNRSQFFAIAAQAMRRILVDHARRRHSNKRNGGEAPVTLDAVEDIVATPVPDEEMLALDAALEQLSSFDRRQANVVELRFFGGLSIEETAQVMDLSATTVKREWTTARAWLYREIQRQSA
ncbi:MAG TPA: sigma-70 family RNA polymerase sigma factor [Vicinamibacterales bacterium]|jgi:RNA polymerase sigma factor (TIGR02999 family)